MTSTIKVNNIQNQCGANIINESSNTITIGASGDTVSLASGASQSGFGRTGTVDWETTPKTANFTAVSGDGYFVNTTSGAVTMTMPSGSAGAIVSIQDYNKTFDTNALKITPASGEKINGGEAGASLTITTEGQGLTFVYVDSTVGWKTVHENEFTLGGSDFIQATGGTITTSGDYKIHTFTSPGTFCVQAVGPAPAPASCSGGTAKVDYLVLAGGGGGGRDVYPDARGGGGGGAGGYRTSACTYCEPAGRANPCGALPVSIQAYPITVGGGGGGGTGSGSTTVTGCRGSNSVFSTITSAGGGAGQGHDASANRCTPKTPGGSGGGFQGEGTPTPTHPTGGKGNTPPTSPVQGFNAGDAGGGPKYRYGGGGGAGAVGGGSPPSDPSAGTGGLGSPNSITGSAVSYGGGGGSAPGGPAAPCGTGGAASGDGSGSGGNGTTNRGGGGGGARNADTGSGGSGVVIIRYRYQ